MTHSSGVHRVTEALADATGRSEEEIRVVLAVGVVVVVVRAAIRVAELIGNLGLDAFEHAAAR